MNSSKSNSVFSRKALIVEDDVIVARSVSRVLSTKLGVSTTLVSTVSDAADSLYSQTYDLVVLDRGLPDGDGFSLLDLPETSHTKLLMLTSISDSREKIRAFQKDVDEYVTKPFDIEEFLLRANSLLRKVKLPKQDCVVVGECRLHLATGMLENTRVPLSIYLTKREARFLELLALSNGHVSKEVVISACWTPENYPTSGTVDVFVSRVRKKLAKVEAQLLIESGYGTGYRLEVR